METEINNIGLNEFINHIDNTNLDIYYDKINNKLFTQLLLPSIHNKSTYFEIYTLDYKTNTYVDNCRMNRNLIIRDLKFRLRFMKITKIKKGMR